MSRLTVNAPYDLGVIDEIPLHDGAAVESTLATAHDHFLDRSKWIPKYERVAILERTMALMEAQKESLTLIAAEEGGKPYVDSKVEVDRAINGIKIAIEEMSHFAGSEIPMGHTASSANRMAFTRKEPIGVVASVSAFNHPLNLIVHQTVPAIAVGTPVIVKPAMTTPRSCIKFVEILKEAGLPNGWCEYLITSNEDSEQLVVDDRVNFFSFIGSARVGWFLRSKLSPGARCALEHGGAAPAIIDQSADLDEIVPPLMKGGFYHSGQVCVSVQRIFAHHNIAEELAQKMAAAAKDLVVGDPKKPETECGPLILPREVDRVDQWVKEAVTEGAQLLCGGQKISDTLYQPTVLLNPSPESKVSREEIFGPVVCVYSYESQEDAVKQANSLPFAFQASVFTKDLDQALNLGHQLNAAAVMINDHTAFRVDWMPFGGRDASGLGMGGIKYSMEDMSREKMLVFKSKYL